MLDRLNGFRRAIEEAFGGHIAPPANVIEGEHAYHDTPSLKGAPIEVQVAWQVSGERLHQIVQPTP
jgi:hypothetical protein